MSVITEDFVAAGKPTYIVANAGVMYTDITDGIVYKQTTIPFGKSWKVISNQNVYIPNSGVTSVNANTPLSSTGGNTPTINIQQAGPTQDGYLSAADWNMFNAGSGGGVTDVTATAPIQSSGGTTPDISIPQAGALTDGFLSSADWGVFNGKFPYPTGTTSQYVRGDGSLDTFPTIPGANNSITHAIASGTDTYSTTITGVTSYADGDVYLIRFTNGNTTGCTLNINSLGAIPLYRNNDGALTGGDIQDGGEMLCVYNSSSAVFQCIGTSPNSLISYVTNAESVAITRGQAVYAFGGVGDRIKVKLAYNTGDSTSAQTIGLVLSASIGANQKGFIMMQGLLDGLSILPTSTWADGDPVYLGSTAGAITKTKQYAPNHLVYLGFVTTASNGAAGRLYVRPQNGYELDELHNVQAQSPNNNDTIYYDSSVSQWKTASLATILGYTPVETTRTISTTAPLSGGGDLSANRTIAITQATTSADGYLSSTDWNTFNNKGSGTVTNVSALTLGTSGTDLSSTVATGATTPVITLNVPSASATARGVVTTGTQTLAGAKTFSTAPILNSLTASQILALDGSNNIQSLSTATYPSLTELSYTKGVTSAVQTQLNGKATSWQQYRLASRWYNNGIFVPANASFTNLLNTIRYVPVYIDQDITVSRMGINVVTAAAAGNTCRLGIYTNDASTCQPLTRLVDSGTLALDSTGAKSVTGLSVSLTKGLYWFAYNSSINSGTITGIGTNFIFDVKGQSAIGGVGFAGFNQSFAYGAFPASASSLTEANSTGTICIYYYY